jgi:hypothetical protein
MGFSHYKYTVIECDATGCREMVEEVDCNKARTLKSMRAAGWKITKSNTKRGYYYEVLCPECNQKRRAAK